MAHAVASYQATLFTLRRLDDTEARGPSLLPRWTRAHVIAHLARNAEGHCRMLEGVMRGEVVVPYPGGADGRAHEIELGSRRTAAELLDDFRRSSEALFEVWERMPADLWDAGVRASPVAPNPSASRPARATVWARWRELEVHHADLDLGFGPKHWPRGFVQMALPRVVSDLPERRILSGSVEPATWLLEADHGLGGWTVIVGPDVTEVRSADAADHHDLAVSGAGWSLLFWLLGRVPLPDAELAVAGDVVDRAASLPELHPYP